MNNATPTPAWLTDVLRQSGMLAQDEVTAVEERKSDAFNSQLAFLQLLYSASVCWFSANGIDERQQKRGDYDRLSTT